MQPPPHPNFSCPYAGSCYQQAKRALHAAVPERLQGREREVGAIRKFLGEHLPARRPGSLYISGPPGTGKTACLSCVLRDCQVPGTPPQKKIEGALGWVGLVWRGSRAHGSERTEGGLFFGVLAAGILMPAAK